MHDTPTDTGEHDDAPNEIVAAAKAHALVAARAKEDRTRRWPLAKIGLAAGIGSAAVAAAVLYAQRRGDDD
jgi:hypothetical protein